MSWSIGKRSFRPTTIYVRGNTALHFLPISRAKDTELTVLYGLDNTL